MLLDWLFVSCVMPWTLMRQDNKGTYFGKINWSKTVNGPSMLCTTDAFGLSPNPSVCLCVRTLMRLLYVSGCMHAWALKKGNQYVYVLACMCEDERQKGTAVCYESVCVYVCVYACEHWELARVLLPEKSAVCISKAQQVFSLAHRCLFFISKNNVESGAACWTKV